jgi:hypothetical protein
MGALFAKKKVVWVPVNEKLDDKCSYPEGWAAVESFRGWKVCALVPFLFALLPIPPTVSSHQWASRTSRP